MGNDLILLDTSILIEYFRKKDKSKTFLVKNLNKYQYSISVLTKYEFSIGTNKLQLEDSQKIINLLTTLPLTDKDINIGVRIYKQLKIKNEIIPSIDILIASVAIANKLKLATLNIKHFIRIKELDVLKI